MTSGALIYHRGIFGDVRGAHNVVAASKGMPQGIVAELAARYTDRLLPVEVSWQPYTCGFPLEDHYVLTRTFAVRASRPGMVQTHAVVLPILACSQIDRLERLLCLLPLECLATDTALLPQEVPQTPNPIAEIVAPDGFASVVRMLVHGWRPVWIGQDRFEQIVTFLWSRLWPEARKELRFRPCAEPADLQHFPATIVCTLPQSRSNWDASYLVDQHATAIEYPSRSEAVLLGLPGGEAIANARVRLQLPLRFAADLKRLESYVHMTELGTADGDRSAFRLLGAIAPDPKVATNEKNILAERLARRTAPATEAAVLGLRNINMSPFATAATHLGGAIESWLRARIAQGSGGTEVVAQILIATNSWAPIARQALQSAIADWSSNTACILWHWWQCDSRLVEPTLPLIPSSAIDAEHDLLRGAPELVGPDLRVALLPAVRRVGWPLLHAQTLAASLDLPVTKKFAQQVEMDFATGTTSGLDFLAANVAVGELLQAALDLKDPRVLALAGEASVLQPQVMKTCDPRESAWLAIWVTRIRAGADPYQGIAQPSATAHQLMDELVAGSQIPIELQRLAMDPRSDLITYPKRSEVWRELDPSIVDQALVRVGRFGLEKLLNGDTGLEPSEPEFIESILASWRAEPSVATPAGIQRLWERFGQLLTQEDFLSWLQTPIGVVALSDALSLGQLVSGKRWKDATVAMHALWRSGRDDLAVAVQVCAHMLGLWDRAHFAYQATKSAVTEDDWWEALLETAVTLYPRGISDQHIWEDAAGDTSRIRGESGEEEWTDALRLLRKGGAGKRITISGLLHQMRRDFHHNTQLKVLEELFHRHFNERP